MRVYPLPSTHPEFSVLKSDVFCEYRVENWHLSRDGKNSVIRNASSWSLWHSLIPLVLSVLWLNLAKPWLKVLLSLAVLFYFWTLCTQVLSESVMVIPSHGIQLETHRGLAPITFFINRRFIPRTQLRDVLINEGIRRWGFRYYLVASVQHSSGNITLEVCFENILPRFPVLLQVYQGIQDLLQTT
ncbi:hypothetical protein K435DRAFT_826501 [Dendrothele bispora CBS 962.96]|uniref:Phosphatidylinositol N-acetylglucosaminyltransferase subunit H conserved domain-containing protein n=1 Tax=Dendrothele bispora (strain CBS 962.96) TaxID=1314807 RepID=A0A4V6T5P4_DENBC|nr:hypothetical protein K435DRAFT_826501 [Dendrothele bispora CBS 962.96]